MTNTGSAQYCCPILFIQLGSIGKGRHHHRNYAKKYYTKYKRYLKRIVDVYQMYIICMYDCHGHPKTYLIYSSLREATEFTSGEGPGIFRGAYNLFHPQSGGGARIFFTLGQGAATFFLEHIFSKKCLKSHFSSF